MRQAALRSALSAKAAEAGVVIVADLNLGEAKTRLVSQTLINLVGTSTALVVLPQKDQTYNTAMRTMKNLEDAKVLLAGYLNIRDLFGYDKLVMPVATLDALVATLG
jgi:large subunit ribosomal protein L4